MQDGTVRGVVIEIGETQTFGQKGFRKRQVVLTQDDGRFTNYIPVEFIQDGCNQVDHMRKGTEVDITFNLTGRKWQKDAQAEVKYFLNAQATGFSVVDGAGGSTSYEDSQQAQQQHVPQQQATQQPTPDSFGGSAPADDFAL